MGKIDLNSKKAASVSCLKRRRKLLKLCCPAEKAVVKEPVLENRLQ
jgi:hypothetical protein